jgi:hypothetical protein
MAQRSGTKVIKEDCNTERSTKGWGSCMKGYDKSVELMYLM